MQIRQPGLFQFALSNLQGPILHFIICLNVTVALYSESEREYHKAPKKNLKLKLKLSISYLKCVVNYTSMKLVMLIK